ncbi:MAG: hypothetical protein H6729_00440 [Deltaproteobacteria bacterium]|nr:hypothetical protein [Deltaproteobacteria bacterium]
MTLIEITIAMAIAVMVTAVAITSTNALTHAALRSGATDVTGAIKFSYDRSIMEKRIQRLGMDLDKGLYWIDYTDDDYGIAATRDRGQVGERPEETEAALKEKAEELDDDFDTGKSEVKRAMESGLAVRFQPDTDAGEPKPLPSGVRFSRIWTGHQEEAFESGVAYLHFFRTGFTEPAQIELTDGSDVITLKLSPLTGRVRAYNKPLDDPDVEDPDGRDEGDL